MAYFNVYGKVRHANMTHVTRTQVDKNIPKVTLKCIVNMKCTHVGLEGGALAGVTSV